MPPLPTTLIGVITLVILVLPGVIYTSVRIRFRGYRSSDRELGSLVLRAISFSFIIDALYLAVFGDALLRWIKASPSGVPAQPRQMGIALFALGVLIPAAIAVFQYGKISLREGELAGRRFKYPWPSSPHDLVPTAWDKAALDRESGWVRIRLSDGSWVGGWYSTESYVSTYPEPPEFYIEHQFRIDENGEIREKVANSAGVWVPLKDVTVVEWIAEPENQGEGN
ncbi:DUF6338 family protein [Nocardia brasiliensis]|uniref:DUF6338 family protein n=1 Tax=Nocardia brasiliensis TaxID=37326 RepID=UPI002455F944|nr:DUF6338 family protein [Nocardia brasiliensis]